MGILIFIILTIGIIYILCKKFNVNKNVIATIIVALIVIVMTVILLNRFNIINKIYNNQSTITQEERNQAIAIIQYANILGIDEQSYETCYFYKNTDSTYYYFTTSSHTTIAGSKGEKINKKGNINSKNQLEKIVNKFEKKIKSENSTMEYVRINYNGKKVKKEEFLNKMFN